MASVLDDGIPLLADYQALLQMADFKQLERFSDQFVAETRPFLKDYRRRWVTDPLHQWSRQWEYPYVVARIQALLASQGEKPIRALDVGSGITFLPFA